MFLKNKNTKKYLFELKYWIQYTISESIFYPIWYYHGKHGYSRSKERIRQT